MHTTLTCTELGQDQVRVLPRIGSPKAIHATKAHSPSCFVGCPMAWCARCSVGTTSIISIQISLLFMYSVQIASRWQMVEGRNILYKSWQSWSRLMEGPT